MEHISPVKKRLNIVLPKEEVNRRIDEAYNRLKMKAKVPGFRPGKAPRPILERLYGQRIMEDLQREIINSSFEEAVKETKLAPVGMPAIEGGQVIRDTDYELVIEMEVRPRLELPQYKGLEFTLKKAEVSEKEVDERLEEIRRNYGRLEDLQEEREIQEGDYVVIRLMELEIEGKKRDQKGQTYTLVVSKEGPNGNISQAVLGKKAHDQATALINFPQDHPDKELAGKDGLLRFEIVDHKVLILPQLDDEFAKTVSNVFKGIQELRDRVRQILEEEKKAQQEARLKQRILDELLGKMEFDVPQCLVDAELNSYIEEREQVAAMTGTSLGDIETQVEALRPLAVKKVKEMLLLADIAEKEGIKVEKEDILRYLEGMVRASGRPLEVLWEYYESRGLLESLRFRILRDKTLNYLVENAKVTEEVAVEPAPVTT